MMPFAVAGRRRAKKELQMGILEELLAGGQRQKEYRDYVSRSNKDTRPRVTPIKRF
jgi:hypothetical protein